MRLQESEPFVDYACYKLWHKKMRRWQVHMVNKNDRNDRLTILYSKYVMSVYHGRILSRHEEVDHVDGDKSNDSIENLEIVSRLENCRRYIERNRAKKVCVKCDYCNNIFILKEKDYKRRLKINIKILCSLSCSHASKRKNKKPV